MMARHSTAASSVRSSSRELVVKGALLAALVVAVFFHVPGNSFLDWDDWEAVQFNPDFNPPTLASLAGYWAEPHLQFYVPVTYTVWWLLAGLAGDVAQGSVAPPVFHSFNLIVHAANTILVFLLLHRLIRRSWAAWMGAAVFAIHPTQVEPVAWVSSMYSSLTLLLSLLATHAFLSFSDRESSPRSKKSPPRRRAWGLYSAGTAAFLLALLTKPTVVGLPFAIAAIEVLLRKKPWRGVARYLGFWVALSVMIVLVTRAVHPGAAIDSPALLRPLIALDTLWFYMAKLVWPVDLVPDYGRTPQWVAGAGVWRPVLVAPVVVFACAAIGWRWSRWPAVIAIVFIAMLLPVLGLAPFDFQRYSTVADRYLYPAMLAVAMLVGWGLSRLPNAAIGAIGAALLLPLGYLAHRQTHVWRDTDSLFRHTLVINPNSLAANSVLGYRHAKRGEFDRAMQRYGRALVTNPGDPRVLLNVGNLLLRQGRFAEAVDAYRHAAVKWSQYSPIYSNMGVALAQSGRREEAVEALQRAIEINPRNADAHQNLALVLMDLQQWTAARAHFEATLRLNPNSDAAKRGLAALRSMGQ